MKIKSLKNVDIKNKTVLVRVDFNVPISEGKILEESRITKTLPTLQYLKEQKCKIVLISHLGRPDGKRVEELKHNILIPVLEKQLNGPVKKVDECIGEKVKNAINDLKEGEFLLLENIRFYPEEEANDEKFSQDLASLGDIYIIDAFATSHRKHASTYGIHNYIPTYAGFLMEKEVKILGDLMEKTQFPLTIVLGGAKIDTKIGLIENFLGKADAFILGGGLANTFLEAEGYDIGTSLSEKDKITFAQEMILSMEELKKDLILPLDGVVADEISDQAETVTLPIEDIEGEMKILDLGPQSLKKIEGVLKKSKTIIWNGPFGLIEKKPFQNGTKQLALMIAQQKQAQTILGGGDTIDALTMFKIPEENFTHVSTGGGAMLEFLEGKTLPGVEIILEA